MCCTSNWWYEHICLCKHTLVVGETASKHALWSQHTVYKITLQIKALWVFVYACVHVMCGAKINSILFSFLECCFCSDYIQPSSCSSARKRRADFLTFPLLCSIIHDKNVRTSQYGIKKGYQHRISVIELLSGVLTHVGLSRSVTERGAQGCHCVFKP